MILTNRIKFDLGSYVIDERDNKCNLLFNAFTWNFFLTKYMWRKIYLPNQKLSLNIWARDCVISFCTGPLNRCYLIPFQCINTNLWKYYYCILKQYATLLKYKLLPWCKSIRVLLIKVSMVNLTDNIWHYIGMKNMTFNILVWFVALFKNSSYSTKFSYLLYQQIFVSNILQT